MRNKKNINIKENARPPENSGGREALLRAMGKLDDFLSREGGGEAHPSLALVRLVPNMDIDQWNSLNKEEKRGNDWHAVEISPGQGVMGALLHYLLYDSSPGYRIDPMSEALLASEFARKIESESARARRGRYELAIGVFSVDNIDRIYASYGQVAAREALMNLIFSLRKSIDSCDSVGRLAGGEYAVIMPGTSIFKLQDLAENIVKSYREKVIASPSGSFTTTLSAGLASGSGEQAAGALVLDNAIEVMQQVAADGGDAARVNRRDIRCYRDNSVLVCSNEKRFLFSGTD